MSKFNKAFPSVTALSKLTLAVICANAEITSAAPVLSNDHGTANVVFDGNNTNITQDIGTVTIDWASFNVAEGEIVNFNQSAGDVAINNIADANASEILGTINADATIFLSNSNGFIFGANSSVNTGSFLATTSNISNGSSADEFNLDGSGSSGSITINDNASINASETGYLAFISKNISTEGNRTSETAGLSASNGELHFRNDESSTIKLSGLNISFPSSSLDSNQSANNIDLEGTSLSAKTVLLNTNDLNGLLESVVNQPTSLAAEDLIVTGYENTEFLLDNSVINFEDSGTDLKITADTIKLKEANILGAGTNLTLNANRIEIGEGLNTFFGGDIGLASITLNGDTYIQSDIKATGDIAISGILDISHQSSGEESTRLWSSYGNISITDTVQFTPNSNNTGRLYVRSEGASFADITGLAALEINTNTLTLNGDVSADNSILIENLSNDKNTEVLIKDNLTLESNSISFENFYFTSDSKDLSFNITGNGSVSLKGSTNTSNSNNLNNININNTNTSSADPKTSNIILSGDFSALNFNIGPSDTINTYDLSLSGDTTFSNNGSFNLNQTDLSGSYLLTLNAIDEATSQATFDGAIELAGLTLKDYKQVSFSNNIEVAETGLLINSQDILFTEDSVISSTDKGSITLNGSIRSNSTSSLKINTTNGNISLGSITGFSNVDIVKEINEGTTVFYGDISASNAITLDKLGDITIDSDFAITSGTEINISNSHLNAKTSDSDITLTANSITADEISGKNIDLNAATIELHDDISASGNLNLLSSDSSLVNINLENDVSLTGNMDFLSSDSSNINFNGLNYGLELAALNSDVYMHTFDENSELNYLSITAGNSTTASNLYFNTTYNAETKSNQIILPSLNGTQGLSLLGNLDLVADANQVLDTSSYNGNLDFSGVNLSTSGSLTFDTGTGDLSLGNISSVSDDALLESLVIQSNGKLNLHGELDITTTTFDFSSANAIELYTDLTLGSAEQTVNVNFGTASINGTYNLSLFTNELTMGAIGNNIALQELNIVHTSETDTPLALNNDITVVGEININANALALNKNISSTGFDVNITSEGDIIMDKEAVITSSFGNVSLISNTGNIGLGQLVAKDSVTVRSEQGYLLNNINDYKSNLDTSKNIISTDQHLYGLTGIGESVSSPIVIDVQNGGTINAESTGTIYIANLANAQVNAVGRVVDGSSGGETATIDAFTQLKLASLNTVNLPSLTLTPQLISNLTWQVDEEESIRKIKSPTSAPAIYYSRTGWRLGQK